MEYFWTSLEDIIDNNYRPLILKKLDVYLNKPIKIDELNQNSQSVNSKAHSWWTRDIFESKKKLVIRSSEIIKEPKNVRFWFKKKAYERRGRHCFNGEQQKVIEMKDNIILVKVDDMWNILKCVVTVNKR